MDTLVVDCLPPCAATGSPRLTFGGYVITTGTVAFITKHGVLVVRHDDGYAVVEIMEGEHVIGRGDEVGASWIGRGGDNLFRLGVEHQAFFHGNYEDQQEAVHIAQHMANWMPPSGQARGGGDG